MEWKEIDSGIVMWEEGKTIHGSLVADIINFTCLLLNFRYCSNYSMTNGNYGMFFVVM